MTQTPNKELLEKFLVLQIENENFLISLQYVSEIVSVKEITETPHQPEWVKGIMNLRNSVISLIDTRKRLGMASTALETHSFVLQAKSAHLNWISKLEESVLNKTPFTLALSHKQCDFGKKVTELLSNDDLDVRIRQMFTELDPTHFSVHDVGKQALELLKEGKPELAIQKTKHIREVLVPKMLNHLDELDTLYSSKDRNIAVIVEYDEHNFAILADDIKKMKTFKTEKKQIASLTTNPFISGTYDDDEGLYQELDLKGILTGKNNELLVNAEEPTNQDN